jgi:hypothetical protein
LDVLNVKSSNSIDTGISGLIVSGIIKRYSQQIEEKATTSINRENWVEVSAYLQNIFPIALGIHPEEIRR